MLLAVPCLAAALLAPARARACSPQPPGLYGSIPEDGGSYPENAVLLFMGQSISLDAVTVTVSPPVGPDPVFVPVDFPLVLGSIAVRLEPPPPAGHTVEIAGDFCPPEYMCEPQAISYLVTSADQTAPAAPSGISFDVYDYPDYVSGGGDCTSDSDFGYWVHAAATPAVGGESPVVYTITALEKDSPDAIISRSFVASEEMVTVVFRLLAEQIYGADPPEAVCFHVTAIDTALNAAPVPDPVCLPCRYRAETSPMNPYPQPEEPAWTAADAYPGGPCWDGTGGTGEGGSGGAGGGDGGGGDGDDAVVGCGCELERAAGLGVPSWLWATFLLAGARLRRRRRG